MPSPIVETEMPDRVFVPFGEKPDEKTQKLIDEGKLVKGMVFGPLFNPSGPRSKAGVWYEPVT